MPAPITISETRVLELEPQPTIAVRIQQPMAELDLASAFDRYLPATFGRVQELGGQMAGAPFARYHAFGPDHVDVEIRVPIAAPISRRSRRSPRCRRARSARRTCRAGRWPEPSTAAPTTA